MTPIERLFLRVPVPLCFSLRGIVFIALLLITLIPVRAAEARPNILWVVNEDHSANYAEGYGDPLAHTPNFARLARAGILFERAYSTSAVCAPTRASIITGMYAPSLGTQHMRSIVPMPPWMRYFPAYLRDAGYFTTNCNKTDYNAKVLPGTWDENSKDAHWRNRRPGQPFFSIFNFAESHESSLHRRFPLTVDPAKVRVPAYLPDTETVRTDIAQYYGRVAAADHHVGEILAQLEADGLAEDTIIFYYSDHGGVIARSKRFLYENGTHPAFAVYFPRKYQHLAPTGPGSRSAELINWVDLAPTVLSLAGVKAPEFMQGRAFAGEFRKPAPEMTYNFRDRMDSRVDFSRAVTDGRWRYIRNYRPDLPILQHIDYLWKQATMRQWEEMYRAGKLNAVQASFFKPKAPEELFDCESDPDNVHNLAGDPAQRSRLENMRSANRAHLLATRDTGFMPEGMLRELAGDRSPSEVGGDDQRYPLADVIDLVDALQLQKNSDQARRVAGALESTSPVLRYWAIVGVLGSRVVPDAQLRDRLKDANTSVRVAAAFELGMRGAEAPIVPVFAGALGEDEVPAMRLEALNWLGGLPHAPAGLQSALEGVAKQKVAAPYDAYIKDCLQQLGVKP